MTRDLFHYLKIKNHNNFKMNINQTCLLVFNIVVQVYIWYVCNSYMSQEFENNHYSVHRLCSVCIDITMMGHIQALHTPGCALPLWHQYTYCVASYVVSNCFHNTEIYRNCFMFVATTTFTSVNIGSSWRLNYQCQHWIIMAAQLPVSTLDHHGGSITTVSNVWSWWLNYQCQQ